MERDIIFLWHRQIVVNRGQGIFGMVLAVWHISRHPIELLRAMQFRGRVRVCSVPVRETVNGVERMVPIRDVVAAPAGRDHGTLPLLIRRVTIGRNAIFCREDVVIKVDAGDQDRRKAIEQFRLDGTVSLEVTRVRQVVVGPMEDIESSPVNRSDLFSS